MPREIPIRAVLVVLASLSDRHYRVSLPNGKEIIAHLERRAPADWRGLPAGTRLIGELSPYDFEHARVAGFAPDDTSSPSVAS